MWLIIQRSKLSIIVNYIYFMPESDRTDNLEKYTQYYGKDILTWWLTALDLIWKNNIGLKPKGERFLFLILTVRNTLALKTH